jgi:hypothetical protein
MSFPTIHASIAADRHAEAIARAERTYVTADRSRGRRSFARFSGPGLAVRPALRRRFA